MPRASWSGTSWAPNSRSSVRRIKKTADAVAAFRTTFSERLDQALPAERTLPVEVWAMDETRLGLHTVRRRRITARGTKPVGPYQQRFENSYLYGAIAPRTGDGYFLGLPWLTSQLFQRFLDTFAQARPATLNVLLVDNSPCHTAHDLVVPANVVLLFQPPYAPELNPAERVWHALKDALAWQCFPDLAALHARVIEIVEDWDAAQLQSLTSYPYLLDAINALSP
jgi:transposase